MSTTDPRLLDSTTLAKRLRDLAAAKRNVDVDFLLHLAEFDTRNAYLDAGYPSLWDFCLRELHLREGPAGRRIAAMRVLRRFPRLEPALRDGRLCLSTVTLLGPVLTPENLDDVVARAAYRTKTEVDHLVVSIQPRVAPKEGIRRLPEPRATAAEAPSAAAAQPGPVDSPHAGCESTSGTEPAPQHRSDDDASPSRTVALSPPAEPRRVAAELRAVSAREWSLRVTIDDACKADLETLVALLSHRNGSDLAGVFHEAVRCAIEKHGKRKGAVEPGRAMKRRPAGEPAPTEEQAGVTTRENANAEAAVAAPPGDAPSTSPPNARSRVIPAAVRREVWKRDGGCCAWIAPDGRRCGSRWKVDIDHIDPFALGGASDDPSKLRLLCARHNARYAEQVYGREHMSRFRGSRSEAAGSHAAKQVTVRGLFVREPDLAWREAGAA